MEKSAENTNKEGKTRSLCSSSRVNGGGSSTSSERQRCEDELTKLKNLIHDQDQQLTEINRIIEDDQTEMKDIRGEKEASINDRRRVDADVVALNNEMSTKRDTLMKLQGSLQYRTEDALNEAIRRLQIQLETNNYKVLEEKKIVQEIDRLKRSKKNLKEYLTLKEDLDRIRERQRTSREQREKLHRQISALKSKEDKLKKENLERRPIVEKLRRDIDELHVQKRNVITELKQLPPVTTTYVKPQSIPQRRPSSFKRKDSSQPLRDEFSNKGPQDNFCFWKKDKVDPLEEKRKLCNTLISYLQKLSGTSLLTPTAQASENITFESTLSDIQDGENLMILRKKNDDDEVGLKGNRGSKKGRKDRKKVQNKLLSHTPETIDQFFKLDVKTPSMLNDIPIAIEALNAKVLSLALEVQISNDSEPSVCPTEDIISVLESDSLKIASMISKVENDILVEHKGNDGDWMAVVNGDVLESELEDNANDSVAESCETVGKDISDNENEHSSQLAKVHVLTIPLSETIMNGISTNDTFADIEHSSADNSGHTSDHLPLIVNLNGSSIQTCNNNLNLSVISSVKVTLLPDL